MPTSCSGCRFRGPDLSDGRRRRALLAMRSGTGLQSTGNPSAPSGCWQRLFLALAMCCSSSASSGSSSGYSNGRSVESATFPIPSYCLSGPHAGLLYSRSPSRRRAGCGIKHCSSFAASVATLLELSFLVARPGSGIPHAGHSPSDAQRRCALSEPPTREGRGLARPEHMITFFMPAMTRWPARMHCYVRFACGLTGFSP